MFVRHAGFVEGKLHLRGSAKLGVMALACDFSAEGTREGWEFARRH